MSTDTSVNTSKRFSFLRHWISLSGLVVAFASLFAFVLLLTMDYFSEKESPYLGILTYLVSPGFLFLGLLMILVGWIYHRRTMGKAGQVGFRPVVTIDLTRPRDRRFLIVFVSASMVFMLVTAIGSYQTYHVTKSVVFCGEACHSIMGPQYTAYQNSPHASVECTACHIAPGAKNFMEAKLGGLHQVFTTWFGQVERPIEPNGKVNIHQRTCTQCHWPQRYVGNLDRTYNHFLDDEENTPYSVRLLLKVGGGDPTHGPVGGIHWHMNVANKVEFFATDEKLQEIPWVRLTDERGLVTVFKTDAFKGDPDPSKIHTMDCMDCHNRPAHQFRTPNDAVDLAMSLGRISTQLPAVKHASVVALTKPYTSKEEGLRQIAQTLQAKYGQSPALPSTIAAVQDIYRIYFFPEMKTQYNLYPNNIGHKDWPGCFRCHDGEHKSSHGNRAINAQDCNSCHTILAEGRGDELNELHPKGAPFKHPEEGWQDMKCYDCHNGTIED
jgi:nitrate/TMAO reductase-like tetraheme cytochrome c subunit